MKGVKKWRGSGVAGLSLLLISCAGVDPIHPFSNPHPTQLPMPHRATGTFDVKVTPQTQDEKVGDPTVGRVSLDKQFHGDLDATSKGQMLAAGTETPGSAGYVAMERVIGTLHGRKGTFALQHSGTMTRGAPQLVIRVVPDSGTGQLLGLVGTMTIKIVEGKHLYEFDYTLP